MAVRRYTDPPRELRSELGLICSSRLLPSAGYYMNVEAVVAALSGQVYGEQLEPADDDEVLKRLQRYSYCQAIAKGLRAEKPNRKLIVVENPEEIRELMGGSPHPFEPLYFGDP